MFHILYWKRTYATPWQSTLTVSSTHARDFSTSYIHGIVSLTDRCILSCSPFYRESQKKLTRDCLVHWPENVPDLGSSWNQTSFSWTMNSLQEKLLDESFRRQTCRLASSTTHSVSGGRYNLRVWPTNTELMKTFTACSSFTTCTSQHSWRCVVRSTQWHCYSRPTSSRWNLHRLFNWVLGWGWQTYLESPQHPRSKDDEPCRRLA